MEVMALWVISSFIETKLYSLAFDCPNNELKAKIKVSAHKFTATAKNAIEAAGGEVVIL